MPRVSSRLGTGGGVPSGHDGKNIDVTRGGEASGGGGGGVARTPRATSSARAGGGGARRARRANHPGIARRRRRRGKSRGDCRRRRERRAIAADVAKRDHATAAALAEDADAVCRLAGDAERLRREVADLERSFGASQFTQTQPPGASGMGATQAFAPARAVSAIGADIEEVEARRSTAEREREALTRRRERAEQEVVQLERNARDLREEHMRISARAEKRAALKRELSDIERDEKEALAEAARLEAERAPHVAAGERLAADREAARASAAKLESAADAAAARCRETSTPWTGDRPIAEYVAGGKADALEQIKAAVASAEEKIAACAERCVAHEEDARRRGETMQRTEQFRRDLDDNITLRKGIAEERKLTEELERLAGEMGGSGEDVDALVEAMRRQTQIRDDLRAEYAELAGTGQNAPGGDGGVQEGTQRPGIARRG